jgi:Uma2 family endonuclease
MIDMLMRLQKIRGVPTTILADGEAIHIPADVVDLESFTRWADSKDFPETGRVCYLNGEVWVDMTKEQLFTHLQIKAEFTFVLMSLIKADGRGLYFPDGLRLSNKRANYSVVPDGTYISYKSLSSGRATLIKGARGGYVEVAGAPDLVLEIISTSSVQKDTTRLPRAYRRARIPEYWLVDARKEPIRFDILKLRSRGYVATRKSGGWVKSGILGKAFQLTRETDSLGYPKFTLSVL